MKEAIKFLSFFIFLTVVISFTSCSESNSKDFEIFQTESFFDFHAIEEFEGTLYATGGDIWNKSILANSTNGSNWTVDSLTNKSVFDLCSSGETLYGVGNDGYIFSGRPKLVLTRTKFWGLLRAFTKSPVGFVASGGKDFNKGWLYKVNSELQIDTAHYFENEILDVACNNTGNCIACGYGVILISNDSGLSWQRSDENGDYYNSITINDVGEFYIVGYRGTIIKSTNNGKSWLKLKDGHSPLANNKPFRTIKFQGEQGIIVGDNGLIWASLNNGGKWEDISVDTNLDIFDFTFFDSHIICASETGQIIKIKI